ncbi:MAG: DUF349 domain-containing protein [Muribaculaceae bacterium]|nr:DUF349 domain-containing protein [Muribaculaceae bacterium]
MTDSEKILPAEENSNLNAEAAATATATVTLSVSESQQPAPEAADARRDDVEIEGKSLHDMSKEELTEELRRIVGEKNVNAHKEVVAIRQALFAIRQREINDELNDWVADGKAPEEFASTPDPVENEAKELMATFRELRAAYLEAEEKRLEENLRRKRELVGEMEKIVEDADSVNQHFARFQELQKEFRDIKDVTPSGEAEIWKRFQAVGEQFYDTLKINKELRDLDFKKNLEAKRRLIEQAIALQDEPKIVEALAKLRILHEEWRAIGPVSKDVRNEIWEEFREASTVIHRKHQEYFDRRKEEEKRNEEAKTALCEKVEGIDTSSLTSYSAWDAMADKVKAWQAEWRTLGFVSRKNNADIYQRFRNACDAFFDAKSKFMIEVRAGLQANYDKKLALCQKAEALLASDDTRGSLDEVIRLQAEWKSIGPVPRKLSDAVWERFTAACREIFNRRRKASNQRHNEENANLEAKRDIIAKLKEIPHDADPREGLKMVKELQVKWSETGHVPFKQKDRLQNQYREVCDTLYGIFRAGRDQERRQNFEGQLDSLKGDSRKLRSERDRLARVLEVKRQELKTYDNNLGFFNIKSASGNSMLKEIERKRSRIEADIKDLTAKIAMIDASEA